MTSLFDVKSDDPMMVAKNFFSEYDGLNFIRCIAHILGGSSYGNEYAMCQFPSELEPDEKPFEGVRFLMNEDKELIVDQDCFIDILKDACRRYLRRHPEKNTELTEVLAKHKISL